MKRLLRAGLVLGMILAGSQFSPAEARSVLTLDEIVAMEKRIRMAAALEEKRARTEAEAWAKADAEAEALVQTEAEPEPPPEVEPAQRPAVPEAEAAQLATEEEHLQPEIPPNLLAGGETAESDEAIGEESGLEEKLGGGGLWRYLKERTKWGVGYDMTYTDNLLLEDNDKQEELTSVLESQMFFLDTVGSLVYGTTYEVNAYRYHCSDANSIDHDLSAFVDLAPSAPYSMGVNYHLDVTNSLVTTTDEIDIFLRSTDFQRQVTHTGTGEFSYFINNLDTLDLSMAYKVVDSQRQPDAGRDKNTLTATADLSHEFRPGWFVSGGYAFTKKRIPDDEDKNSVKHLGTLGLRYDLTEEAKLNLRLQVGKITFNELGEKSILSFDGAVKYPIRLRPRLTINLGYRDTESSSEAVGTTTVRARRSSIGLEYAVTSLITFESKAAYIKNRSTSSAGLTTFGRSYTVNSGFAWNLRENAKLLLGHTHARSKSGDYTSNVVALEFEMEI